MIIIRPITLQDTEPFIKIAFDAGIGMTSMPKNREKLIKRIHESDNSFKKTVSAPQDEFYLFVLEDLETGKIGGTCGISAQTARQSPLFFYRVERREKHEDVTHAIKKIPVMRPVQYKNYWSEICSLYLAADFRHSGHGRLLSLSRFLFIANDSRRFSRMLFAEMRGHIENGRSAFWEGVGHHFIDADFNTLMQHRDEGHIELIQALPVHPIYIELLPKEVQESIGKVHELTQPALQMLLQEGFKISPEIDICDGGPKIEAETREIRSVKDSAVDTLSETVAASPSSSTHIVARHSIDFRACLTAVDTKKNGGVVISKDAADALKLKVGDPLRYVLASPPDRKSHE